MTCYFLSSALPYAVDLFGGNFFATYPASLDIVEPVFSIPAIVLIGKFIYGLVGLAMMLIAGIRKEPNNR